MLGNWFCRAEDDKWTGAEQKCRIWAEQTNWKQMADRSPAHLTDLIERVLPITACVFEVVVCRECTVNVTSDGTVLRGFLVKDKWEK